MLMYRRDVRAEDQAVIDETVRHVREHLLSIVASDDDPNTTSADVKIWAEAHRDGDPGLVSVMGQVDAEPSAPYLSADFDADDDHGDIRFRRYREISGV